MRSDLDGQLRRLYRAPVEDGRDEHRAAHERALVAAVARRRGGGGAAAPDERRPWSWLRLPRLALAGALGVAVVVGACVMPAEYPMSLGYGLELTLPAARLAELDPTAIGIHFQEQDGLERVEVRVQHRREQHVGAAAATSSEEILVQVFVFGDAVDPDALASELQQRFPVLADAQLREVPISGTVHGTLGGKLSHRFLDVVLDEHGVEEAERRVLAELVAQGVAPQNATVDITEERGPDGERRIEVRVEAEHAEHVP